MRYWKEIWEGLEKESMAVRYLSVDGNGVRSGNLGMKGKGGGREITRKVSEMGVGCRGKNRGNTRIFGERRNAKREVER